MSLRVLMASAITLAAASAHADVLLTESFADVSSLAGKGWVITNLSTPVGITAWFQGDATVFTAQSGSAESYVAANYNNAVIGGTVNDWLISPTFSTAVSGSISFWARGAAEAGYVDTFSYGFAAGSSASTAGFSKTISATAGADWTNYTLAYAAQGAGSVGRFAINYFGPADRSNYVGIDTVTVSNVAAVPEPGTWALMALGMAGLGVSARRKRAAAPSQPF